MLLQVLLVSQHLVFYTVVTQVPNFLQGRGFLIWKLTLNAQKKSSTLAYSVPGLVFPLFCPSFPLENKQFQKDKTKPGVPLPPDQIYRKDVCPFGGEYL